MTRPWVDSASHRLRLRAVAALRRTLGLCLEHEIGFVTLVPRTCAIRQALEAWGQQHPTLPLLVEKPGRTKAEAPRHWHDQSVYRLVEVEDSKGQVTQGALRFVVVHASQRAPQQTQIYSAAQAKETEAVAAHSMQVQAGPTSLRQFPAGRACRLCLSQLARWA